MAAAGGSFIAARSGNGCQEEKEKEVTDRELWAGCCIKWLLRY
mgnify:CR=1 FL=1